MTEIKGRKCPGCGAPLVGGSYHCEYCHSDWTPPKKEDPLKEIKQIDLSKFIKTQHGQVVVFFFVFIMFAPAAPVYMWLATDWTRKTKIIVTLLFVVPIAFSILAFFGTIIFGAITSLLH